ncbi:MAG: hypothetical protein M1828_003766 [Chrysothrix sp. TS-e1954]|nr:MAG: hypothetical protein M1828_003766 [Chrysothrix sp. TS-e1954]
MYPSLLIAALATLTSAFPALRNADPKLVKRAAEISARSTSSLVEPDALGISAAETNCGPTPCLDFDPEDQIVSTTGKYAWASPAADEIRGPCPGLNAAANHGYIPRSGILSVEEAIDGMGAAYSMAPDLAGLLAAYAVAIDGNVAQGVWSIGGPLPVGTGQGISYSHNTYEGDGSVTRNDAYTNNGDAHSLNVEKFEAVYTLGGDDTSEEGRAQRYTPDKLRARLQDVQNEAIATNPYYFVDVVSTLIGVSAAYNFLIQFMSNHSAAEPSGYLDGYNFKSFFGITGSPGSFVWHRGQERIPDMWYRRPTSNQYTAIDVVGDLAIGYLAYPSTLRFGGNTGTPNSFTGVSITNLTGNLYNAQTLFTGNNFACFTFQLTQQAVPDFVKGPLSEINAATKLLNANIDPLLAPLACPQLGKYDQGLFNSYPGRTYSPTGPDTNYKI